MVEPSATDSYCMFTRECLAHGDGNRIAREVLEGVLVAKRSLSSVRLVITCAQG